MSADMNVAVYHIKNETFVHHIDCPGEERVRIDIHDGLTNYLVFEVEELGNNRVKVLDRFNPLDWRIDYS